MLSALPAVATRVLRIVLATVKFATMSNNLSKITLWCITTMQC